MEPRFSLRTQSSSKLLHPWEQRNLEEDPSPSHAATLEEEEEKYNPLGSSLVPIYNKSSHKMKFQHNMTSLPPVGDAKVDDEGPQHMSVPTLITCMAFVVFICWCTLPRSPAARGRMSRIRLERQQRAERLERMKDPKYREEVLKNSLWIQKVLKAEGGELTLGPADAPDPEVEEHDCHSAGARGSVESISDETNTCIICLEPYQVGDVLAWSRRTPLAGPEPAESFRNEEGSNTTPTGEGTTSDVNTTVASEDMCNHVFHKDCIYSWLMNPKHDDCPACRAKIAREPPMEEGEDGVIKPSFSEDSADFLEQEGSFSNSVAFVVVHGLVSRVRRASYGLIGSSIRIDGQELEQAVDHHNTVPGDYDCEFMAGGVEMIPPVSEPVALPAFPFRKVASFGDRPVRPLLRRRSSFGSSNNKNNNTGSHFINKNTRIRAVSEGSVGKNVFPITEGVPPPAFPLRRTLSGGSIARSIATPGGGTVLVLKQYQPAVPQPSPLSPPKRSTTSMSKYISSSIPQRPVWSAEAERALSESLDARMSSRPMVPAEICGGTTASGGFGTVFRKNLPGGGFAPVPATSRPKQPATTTAAAPGTRKKKSYELLTENDFSDHSDSERSNEASAGVV